MASTISLQKEKKKITSAILYVSSDRCGVLTGGTGAPHWSWLLEGTTVNKLQVLLLPKEQWAIPTIPPESPMSWLPVIYQNLPGDLLNFSFLCSSSLLSSVHFKSFKRQRLALPNAKNHNGYFHHFSLLFFFFPFKSPAGSKVLHKHS